MYNLQYWFIKHNDIDQVQVSTNVLNNKTEVHAPFHVNTTLIAVYLLVSSI